MKRLITALLIFLCGVFTVRATPLLHIQTTITKHHTKSGRDILALPEVTVRSGEQAIIQVGQLSYAVTPTVRKDGQVNIVSVLTQGGDKLEAPKILGKVGQATEFQIGELAITTTASLSK